MGLERLSQYLLDHEEVTAEQLDEARRTQGFFGGQVVSHLLKLGFIDEQTLGRALTDVTGAPYATRDHLTVLPADVVGIVPAKLLEESAVCPFEIVEGRLRIAMLNPRDAVALGKIRNSTSYILEPWVTCEYRLYLALERHYRIVPKGRRAITLAPPQRQTSKPRERQIGSDSPTVPEIEVGLDGRPLDDEITVDDHLGFAPQVEPVSPPGDDSGEPTNRWGGIETVEPPGQPGPLDRLDDRLAYARSRDDIAQAVVEFCRSRASRTALFAVGRTELRGLAGTGPGLNGRNFRVLTLPVVPSSVFDDVLQRREHYFGVVPPLDANREAFSPLGGKLPAMATVLPVPVKGRVAALLYLDDEDRPMGQPDIHLMRRVAAKTGLAFEIFLLRNKLTKI